MLPPRLVRRLLAAPLVVAIAAALAVLAPPVAACPGCSSPIPAWTG